MSKVCIHTDDWVFHHGPDSWCIACLITRTDAAEAERDSARAYLLDVAETERQLRASVAELEAERDHPLDLNQRLDGELMQARDRAARADTRAEAAEAERDAAVANGNRYRIALESFTPGGSEYAGDLDRCVSVIRERLNREHAHVLRAVKERKQAEAERDRLAGVVEWVRAWVENRNMAGMAYQLAELRAAIAAATEPKKDGER